MAIQNRNTLKNWFIRGAKPLANQFADWIDSFRHKNDAIAIDEITGLQDALNNAASSEDVEAVADQLAAGLIGVDGVDGTIKISPAESPNIGVVISIFAEGSYQVVFSNNYNRPPACEITSLTAVYNSEIGSIDVSWLSVVEYILGDYLLQVKEAGDTEFSDYSPPVSSVGQGVNYVLQASLAPGAYTFRLIARFTDESTQLVGQINTPVTIP